MTNNTEILRTEGLKRSYLVNETKIDVLKGINLTINNQEFIAIMGKSGSGKTTLLKLLGLLDRPTEGKVFFKGEDSNSLRGDRLAMIRRREIGFIYQDYYLMDSLSVIENIMLPKILDHSPVEESITEAEKLADIMGFVLYWIKKSLNYQEAKNKGSDLPGVDESFGSDPCR